jgi:threonine/homoserine/homoserine lactone efflux protein
MNFLAKFDSNVFFRALSAVAITGPILLVFAAATMPDGIERGDLIVYGHAVILSILATALVVRAAYVLGFCEALKTLQRRRQFEQVTA